MVTRHSRHAPSESTAPAAGSVFADVRPACRVAPTPSPACGVHPLTISVGDGATLGDAFNRHQAQRVVPLAKRNRQEPRVVHVGGRPFRRPATAFRGAMSPRRSTRGPEARAGVARGHLRAVLHRVRHDLREGEEQETEEVTDEAGSLPPGNPRTTDTTDGVTRFRQPAGRSRCARAARPRRCGRRAARSHGAVRRGSRARGRS
jgi:hypothetical protein